MPRSSNSQRDKVGETHFPVCYESAFLRTLAFLSSVDRRVTGHSSLGILSQPRRSAERRISTFRGKAHEKAKTRNVNTIARNRHCGRSGIDEFQGRGAKQGN